MDRVRNLHEESRAAFHRGDYMSALTALQELNGLTPCNPHVLYDLACARAKTGSQKAAVETLQQSVKCGHYRWKHTCEDPDLETIRGDERVSAAIAEMKANSERRDKSMDDPYGFVSAEPCPTAESVRAILAYYGPLRKKLMDEGYYLGPWPTHETDWRYLRGQIDALQTYVEEHPKANDAPEGYLCMVQTYADLHQPAGLSGPVRGGTAARMRPVVEAFGAAHPNNPLFREARYLLIDAERQGEFLKLWLAESTDTNALATLCRQFGQEFLSLADVSVGEKTEGMALCQAIKWRMGDDNPDLQSKLIARLRACMNTYQEVQRMGWDCARIPLLKAMGTPSFEEKDTEGHLHTLDQYKGKLIILDFWATWCGPCRQELPEMKDLLEEYQKQGVAFLGIPLEDGESMPLDKFTEWCRKEGVAWPQLYRGEGWKHPLAEKYHIRGVPTLIFIDREGVLCSEGHAHSALHWIREELGLPPPDCHGSTNSVGRGAKHD